jgi:hypothetical protein
VQDPEKLKLARVVVVNDANGQQRNTLYPLQVGFKKYGRAASRSATGCRTSASCVDDLAVIRSMWTTDDNHGAQTQFHSGRHMLDGEFPTLGAWVHYGLGSLNDNLPQFISSWAARVLEPKDGHYLGPAHDAVPLRVDPANPLDFGKPEGPLAAPQQKGRLRPGRQAEQAARASSTPDDPALAPASSRTSWPSACRSRCRRCSTSRRRRRRRRRSTASTARDARLRHAAAGGAAAGRARRAVHPDQHGAGGAGAWDAHGGLKANHSNELPGQVDKPIGGLLKDLKQRGLLDETLVVFATEFGRTPGSQGATAATITSTASRVWMAGGGIKGGVVHGATDEIGFHAVEDRHYVTDIHATILHQLGLDSRAAGDPRPQAPRDRPRAMFADLVDGPAIGVEIEVIARRIADERTGDELAAAG